MNTWLNVIQHISSKITLQEPLFGHKIAEVSLFVNDVDIQFWIVASVSSKWKSKISIEIKEYGFKQRY